MNVTLGLQRERERDGEGEIVWERKMIKVHLPSFFLHSNIWKKHKLVKALLVK